MQLPALSNVIKLGRRGGHGSGGRMESFHLTIKGPSLGKEMGGVSCLLELWSYEGEKKVLHLHYAIMGLQITYCTMVITVH